MPVPDHYSRLSPQPIEVIEAWGLNFHLGSVIKYIARLGHKDPEVTELRKARWYIDRYIKVREAQQKALKPPPPEEQV